MSVAEFARYFVARIAARCGFADQLIGDWVILAETSKTDGTEAFLLFSSSEVETAEEFLRRVVASVEAE